MADLTQSFGASRKGVLKQIKEDPYLRRGVIAGTVAVGLAFSIAAYHDFGRDGVDQANNASPSASASVE